MTQKKSFNEFSTEYIKIISIAGKHFCPFSWHAIWLSSKNRFNSPLIHRFEKLINGEKLSEREVDLLTIVKAMFSIIKTVGIMLVSWLVTRICLWQKYKKNILSLKGKDVYLIKSFAYKHSFGQNKFNDPFFGDVPGYLSDNNKNILTIYAPIGCMFKSIFENRKIDKLLPFIYFLKVTDFVWPLIQIYKNYNLKINSSIYFFEHDVTGEINTQYKFDSLNDNTYFSLLFYKAFFNLAGQLNVKDYVHTFENNPWEKMCILALRKRNKNIVIRGYQHSVLPLASLNMFPAEGEYKTCPFPDKILTVGKVVADILKSRNAYGDISITPACAVRYKYLESLKFEPSPIKKVLLVGLEGVVEAARVAEYVIDQAAQLSSWKIIIRTHPALPFEKLDIQNRGKILKLDNVFLSNEVRVIDDLKQSGVMLYWGSAVALEALKMGIPVIHYDFERCLNYDPLFDFQELKWTVTHAQELSTVLNLVESLSEDILEKKRNKAISYLNDYFYPSTPENLSSFL